MPTLHYLNCETQSLIVVLCLWIHDQLLMFATPDDHKASAKCTCQSLSFPKNLLSASYFTQKQASFVLRAIVVQSLLKDSKNVSDKIVTLDCDKIREIRKWKGKQYSKIILCSHMFKMVKNVKKCAYHDQAGFMHISGKANDVHAGAAFPAKKKLPDNWQSSILQASYSSITSTSIELLSDISISRGKKCLHVVWKEKRKKKKEKKKKEKKKKEHHLRLKIHKPGGL